MLIFRLEEYYGMRRIMGTGNIMVWSNMVWGILWHVERCLVNVRQVLVKEMFLLEEKCQFQGL